MYNMFLSRVDAINTDEDIHVFVNTFTGDTLSFLMNVYDRIYALKYGIQKRYGVPIDTQRYYIYVSSYIHILFLE